MRAGGGRAGAGCARGAGHQRRICALTDCPGFLHATSHEQSYCAAVSPAIVLGVLGSLCMAASLGIQGAMPQVHQAVCF